MPKTKGAAKAKVGAVTPKKKGKRTADETVDVPQAKPAKRMKATEESAKASASVPDKEAEIPEPKFSGNFDIYAATLPFLTKVCLPSGQTTPQYEELYKTILTYQAKPDSSGRCYLPAGATSAGKFECSQVEDPMSEEALDVEMNFVTKEKKLSFTRAERGKFKTPGSSQEGPGISATTTLEGSHCGFDSAEGVFKMTRVWAKAMPTGEAQSKCRIARAKQNEPGQCRVLLRSRTKSELYDILDEARRSSSRQIEVLATATMEIASGRTSVEYASNFCTS